MKNITRRYWGMIPIPDTVIGHVNLLGKYPPDILVFAYFKGLLIGYGDIELTGVNGDENDAPLQIEN